MQLLSMELIIALHIQESQFIQEKVRKQTVVLLLLPSDFEEKAL